MANGRFNSGSSSRSSGFSSRGSSFGSFGRFGGPRVRLPWWANALIFGLFAIVVLKDALIEKLTAPSLAEEEELDRTTYHKQAMANFQRWQKERNDIIDDGSFWMESGSSRRGDFHCKGGSYLVNNRDVYYCCSVYPPGEPKAKAGLCETIRP